MNRKWPNLDLAEHFFGKINFGNDGKPTDGWERTRLVTIRLPFVMRASWNPAVAVHKAVCHKECKTPILGALERMFVHYGRDMDKVRAEGLDSFASCYSFAPDLDGKLTAHCFGAAFRFGVEVPAPVRAIFESYGARWNGQSFEFMAAAEVKFDFNPAPEVSAPADDRKAKMLANLAKARAAKKQKQTTPA